MIANCEYLQNSWFVFVKENTEKHSVDLSLEPIKLCEGGVSEGDWPGGQERRLEASTEHQGDVYREIQKRSVWLTMGMWLGWEGSKV